MVSSSGNIKLCAIIFYLAKMGNGKKRQTKLDMCLLKATMNENMDCVQALVEHGADVNAVELFYGNTPIWVTIY